jgi:rhodanese-related sulfurtransferase
MVINGVSANEELNKTREELDKQVFYFKTLYEASRELDALIQPRKIMDAFLLMTLGSLGITQGLVALFNTETRQSYVVGRGIPEPGIETFKETLPQFFDHYFSQRPGSASSFPKIQIIRENLIEHMPLAVERGTLTLWSVGEEYVGVTMLGSKISDEPQTEDDSYLLFHLTNILIGALSRAISTMSIQQLNAGLQKKNVVLEDALNEVQRASEELDRRVFHLKTIADLHSELSPSVHLDTLLQTFLLMIMGTFGVTRGFALFLDREAQETKKVRAAFRGVEAAEYPSPASVERLLYKCFDGLESRRLTPLGVFRILNASEIFEEHGIAIGKGTGLLFYIDQALLGIIALGPTMSGPSLSKDEEELLFTQSTSLMIYLKNAKAFEKISDLNEGLIEKNEELQKTITELTEAKHKIVILEKARAHIRAIIQRERERSGRMNALDVALILLMATVIAVLFNFANPQGIRLFPETLFRPASALVDVKEAKELLDSGKAVLVDARPKEFFEQRHIQGAINLPPALFDIIYMMKLAHLDSEAEILVYGRSISKLYDEEVAHRLRQRDHERVRILSGDLDRLRSHGFQVQP